MTEGIANPASGVYAKSAMLDRSLPTPLYHQLQSVLLERIQSGEWTANDRLPTEEQLESQFNVSKATVRQALNLLATSGFVRREQTRGTFVAERRIELGPCKLTGFGEEMRAHGLRPASRVLVKDIVKAEGDVAGKLRLEEGQSVFCLERLRLAGGQPMGIQTAYIRADLVAALLDQDFESGSLYELLGKKCGLAPEYAHETHFAVLLDREQCALLEVPEGSPGLAAERLTFLAGGRPLELVYSVMRGDRYRVTLNLVRVVKDRV